MALSFPASPTVNQTYTLGSKTWIWNGTTWKALVISAATTVNTVAPTSAVEGQMWYDTTDGTLYIRTGSVWLESVVTVGASTNPLPSGTTAQRPGSPVSGTMRVNSETNYVELYQGSSWFNLNYIGLITAISTNATVTYVGNYAIHTFLTSGTFTPTSVPVGGTVDYLIVAGGGAGAGYGLSGGGGGAGGLLTGSISVTSQFSYSLIVGAGGTGNGSRGSSGSNSTGFSLVSIGGGAGGSHPSNPQNGLSGGSGGGGSQIDGSGGTGTEGQGTAGAGLIYAGGGGGGGKNAAGSNTTGGAGYAWLNGIYYAGGGGAGERAAYSVPQGSGGIGGGGSGGNTSSPNGFPGTANTGGGGGGSGGNNGSASILGGNGGSGIVIIRYRYQ